MGDSDNKDNINDTAVEKFKKDYLEFFREQRKKGEGAGGIFEMFFKDSDPEFIDRFEKQLASYAVAGRNLAAHSKQADKDPGLREKLRKGFSDIAAAQSSVKASVDDESGKS